MTGSLPPLAIGAAMRWDMVRRLLPASPGDLLEIGCGQGGFAVRLAARSRSFLGLEPDRRSFATAHGRLPGAILNITADDLPAGRLFDTVCAFEVIEHLPDDKGALASWVARVRPGGTLFLSAPAYASRLGASDAMAGHYRRYDPADMARLMTEAGLVDVTVRVYGGPLSWVLEMLRNGLAKLILARSQGASFDERTAGSGRFLQPGSGLFWRTLQVVIRPLLLVQHVFPNRGVALVAMGRRPAETA
ncbi:class I SAM-dependent methyltransferase [Sphingomonas parva]|uniref:Class I SAM-dependent methyltransferase n=1 Tax=Sphingomonas parva TaxID=2555898 RepID=A0A4Y8ZQS3_9SPHN|nr:class I SAM-dependent methyltransferase [Sphingomonas parva]TFI57485.1 class I SAM-dependent methyltransferase [Sphingomonas parva]